MGRLQFATVSPMTACRTCKPAASLTCSTYLAACLLLTPFQDASWLLKPWCLPICLFALKCLRSAAAETIGQFYHLPLSPISTVVIIFTNHLPEALVPVISFKLSRDDYGGICFFQITFSDVTFLICFHDLLVFFIISFSGCHSCCHIKCCHKLFIFLSTHFHFLKQLAFDCNVTPPALPASKNQRWASNILLVAFLVLKSVL